MSESLKVAKENGRNSRCGNDWEELYLLRHELILHDGVDVTSRW